MKLSVDQLRSSCSVSWAVEVVAKQWTMCWLKHTESVKYSNKVNCECHFFGFVPTPCCSHISSHFTRRRTLVKAPEFGLIYNDWREKRCAKLQGLYWVHKTILRSAATLESVPWYIRWQSLKSIQLKHAMGILCLIQIWSDSYCVWKKRVRRWVGGVDGGWAIGLSHCFCLVADNESSHLLPCKLQGVQFLSWEANLLFIFFLSATSSACTRLSRRFFYFFYIDLFMEYCCLNCF